MKRLAIVLIAIFGVLTVLMGFSYAQTDEVELVVLMYHNVIPDKLSPNKFEVRLSELRRDFQYIKDFGLTCVTPTQLVEYTEGKRQLDKRCVMLTFDDGFYYYNTILQQLLHDYGYTAVISVVGNFTEFNKQSNSPPRYTYMDYDDMQSMARGGNSEIAAHSFALHSLKGRKGVARNKGEDADSYNKMFDNDCKLLEAKLLGVGISPICYTYPYGAYCKEAEQVIKNRGYKVSLTCNEKINIITRNVGSLFLLGRYNRDGVNGSVEKIIAKHWRA